MNIEVIPLFYQKNILPVLHDDAPPTRTDGIEPVGMQKERLLLVHITLLSVYQYEKTCVLALLVLRNKRARVCYFV